MPDRKQVIWDIERCICHVPDACRDCSKCTISGVNCMESLMEDALALLREQEPVMPIKEPYKIVCGSCGEKLAEICGDVDVVWNDDGKYPRYCPGCGQAVKWEVSGDAAD